MKKSLIALAIAGAFSGAAFAQSSVTLFGVADTGLTYVKGDGNGNIKGMSNSGLNSSRLGFRGTEDLGGGLKANFWFEMGVNTDSGVGAASNSNNQASSNAATTTTTTIHYANGQTLPNGTVCATAAGCDFAATSTSSTAVNGTQGLSFNRRMFVGMSGGFGEFRLGRNYTPIFMQVTSNDPFGTNGIGQTTMEALVGLNLVSTGGSAVGGVTTNVRESNAIEYLTPAGIGGVYVHGMFAFGENASNASNPNDGRGFGVRAGWAGGPADISVAYNNTKLLQSATAGTYTVWGVAGTLTFGPVKPMFQFYRHKVDITNAANPDPQRTDFMLGLVATFGATDLRASFNNNNVKHPGAAFDGARQYAIGPVYNLSKRTALYGTLALIDNKKQSVAWGLGTTGVGTRTPLTPGGKSDGAEIGIRHSF